MAINASTSMNSSIKAADSSFCSQRDLSAAPSFRELRWAEEKLLGSHKEIRYPTGGQATALGAAYPGWPLALLILKREASGRELTWGMAMNSLGASFSTGDN